MFKCSWGEMIEPLRIMVGASNINFAPIVTEDQVTDFEAFAKDYYATDPETTSYEGLGENGIYAIDESGQRFHNNKSAVPYETKYDFLSPVLQFGVVKDFLPVALANSRYDVSRGFVQERIADCFYSTAGDVSSSGCASLTDFTKLVVASAIPNSIFFYPVAPSNNRTSLTGFINVVFDWDIILENMVPKSSSSDFKLYLELNSPTATKTFTVDSNDGIIYVGSGSLHDSAYDKYGQTARINAVQGMAPSSNEFTVSIFPHEDMIADYYSNYPDIFAVVASLGLFVFVLIIFALDYFIASKLYDEELTSSLRKTFLRYISHEIRTPLNAVYMGLTVLLQQRDQSWPSPVPSTSSVVNIQKTGQQWGQATGGSVCSNTSTRPDEDIFEMKRNLESAMVVLDDLVTYVRLTDTKKGYSYHKAPIVCAGTILRESINSVANISREYNTSVLFEDGFKGDGLTMRGDSEDLQLVFTYMLQLAVKMTTTDDPIVVEGQWYL